MQKDEDAFKQTQEEERAKQARTRKLQDNVNGAREQNAKRKLEKAQAREWDSGKEQGKGKPRPEEPDASTEDSGEPGQPSDSNQWHRGTSSRGGPPTRGPRGSPRGAPRGASRGSDRGEGRGTSNFHLIISEFDQQI